MYQQVISPYHTAGMTQEWLAEPLHDHVTPKVFEFKPYGLLCLGHH